MTKNISSNSVAVGVPCKVMETIDDYYKKNKDKVMYTKDMSYKDKKEYVISNIERWVLYESI